MKRYKLCDSCIHHQLNKVLVDTFYCRINSCYIPACNKSLTPTIRNNQEHCPKYRTDPNPHKTKRK